LKTIIINRKRWARGNQGGYLLNAQSGKMCCLGFCAKSFGISTENIIGINMPKNITSLQKDKLPKWLLLGYGPVDVEELAFINDESTFSDEEREEKIKKIFKKHKINVKFVG